MHAVQNHICIKEAVHEQHSAMTLIGLHDKVTLPLLCISLGHVWSASELRNVASKCSQVTDFVQQADTSKKGTRTDTVMQLGHQCCAQHISLSWLR